MLFSLKPKEKKAGGTTDGKKKKSAAHLRLQKDISELQLSKTTQIHFEDPDNLMAFTVTVQPDEGFYQGGKFVFDFKVPEAYPHEPPKVTCTTKVYHPNIDLQGAVCLNILREAWKPILSISAVIYGLVFLFLDPNPGDPLNKDAARVLKDSKSQFAANVSKAMRGGYVDGVQFPRVL